jgi:Sulfotransferase family
MTRYCTSVGCVPVRELRRRPPLSFPDFLVIGAQKAGTSWLASNLSRHSNVWMPPLKELHYFDERIKELPFGASLIRLTSRRYTDEDWYPWYWRYQLQDLLKRRFHRYGKNFDPETLLWALKFFGRPPSDRWYASLFEQGRGKITGEATPDYSILEEGMVARIHELMPQAKIIFFMRNPIERPYSSAVMQLRNLKGMGREVEAAALQSFFVSFSRQSTVDSHTRYLRSLEKWRRFYPDKQIFVGFLEDIQFYPVQLLQRLYGFMELDPSHTQEAKSRKINPGFQENMPTQLATQLARTYYDDLHHLSACFGGYTYFWLYCAEKLTKGILSEDEIPYPLWDSWFWEEWTKGSRSSTLHTQDVGVQSGPLTKFFS